MPKNEISRPKLSKVTVQTDRQTDRRTDGQVRSTEHATTPHLWIVAIVVCCLFLQFRDFRVASLIIGTHLVPCVDTLTL